MEVSYLESDATSVQMQAIAARLGQCYITNEIIYNPYDEAVAVYVPGVLSARAAYNFAYKAMDCAPLFEEVDAEQYELVRERLAFADALGHTIPTGLQSGWIYPMLLHHVIDNAVITATNGTQLGRELVAYESGGGDAAAHIDFPGSLANPGRDELHGLNIHLTLSGKGQARFGLMREFQSATNLAEGIHQAQQNGLTSLEINRYIATAGAQETDPRIPATLQEGVANMELAMQQASAPVTLHPGDVIIFQARQHREKELLPTVHEFKTAEEPRWYTLFTPRGAARRQTNATQDQLSLEILEYWWGRMQGQLNNPQ